MNTNTRASEFNTFLHGTPSYQTRKNKVIHRLGVEANLLVRLIEQLKPCTGIRPPDRYGDHYGPEEHLRLAEERRYDEALSLIATKGRR